jgi:hypothetical protein
MPGAALHVVREGETPPDTLLEGTPLEELLAKYQKAQERMDALKREFIILEEAFIEHLNKYLAGLDFKTIYGVEGRPIDPNNSKGLKRKLDPSLHGSGQGNIAVTKAGTVLIEIYYGGLGIPQEIETAIIQKGYNFQQKGSFGVVEIPINELQQIIDMPNHDFTDIRQKVMKLLEPTGVSMEDN